MTLELSEISIDFKLDSSAIKKLSGGDDVERALEVIGQVGEASAKGDAPVDTGHLRRSITHELGKSGFDQFVRIGTNVNYAIFQELGTRFHPAQPFLRPALGTIEAFLKS
jgi:HK97 gp10 family phage protein